MRVIAALLIAVLPLAAFPVPKPAQTRSVAGTTWKGPIQWTNYQLLEHTIIFEEGGKSA